MVVLYYKDTMNTELTNTEPMLLGGIQGYYIVEGNTGLSSRKPLVTTFSSTNQYITLFYGCFCLKTLYLICLVYSTVDALYCTFHFIDWIIQLQNLFGSFFYDFNLFVKFLILFMSSFPNFTELSFCAFL